MNLKINLGKYVVAVSGGVDSVSLLDMLAYQEGLDLIVAHFDHGIRQNSAEDRDFVAQLSRKYRLPFEYAQGFLGRSASEATARKARYDFLFKVMQDSNAQAIITAHHSDDVLETIIINLLRGTGRRGLSSLQSTPVILRPLLNKSKAELITYAKQRGLIWKDDSTNDQDYYLRNRVRRSIIPKLTNLQKKSLLSIYQESVQRNKTIDLLIEELIGSKNSLDRSTIVSLPHKVSLEVVAQWLKQHDIADINTTLIEGLTIKCKTMGHNKVMPISKNTYIKFTAKEIELVKDTL